MYALSIQYGAPETVKHIVETTMKGGLFKNLADAKQMTSVVLRVLADNLKRYDEEIQKDESFGGEPLFGYELNQVIMTIALFDLMRMNMFRVGKKTPVRILTESVNTIFKELNVTNLNPKEWVKKIQEFSEQNDTKDLKFLYQMKRAQFQDNLDEDDSKCFHIMLGFYTMEEVGEVEAEIEREQEPQGVSAYIAASKEIPNEDLMEIPIEQLQEEDLPYYIQVAEEYLLPIKKTIELLQRGVEEYNTNNLRITQINLETTDLVHDMVLKAKSPEEVEAIAWEIKTIGEEKKRLQVKKDIVQTIEFQSNNSQGNTMLSTLQTIARQMEERLEQAKDRQYTYKSDKYKERDPLKTTI